MNRLKTILLFLVISILPASIAFAQDRPDPENPESRNLEVPANWNVRPDHPGENITIGPDDEKADIYFVNMVPGWHVTTGPAAIFWHPASTAGETYHAETVIHLFDPKGRNEAFGLFIGGRGLDGTNQAYSYFLLRNSGEYLIKNREGDDTELVRNWSDAPSMNAYGENTETSVENRLGIEVRQNQVSFFVNGKKVDTVPRTELYTDGIVGLRINHRLNVHIEDLAVTESR